MKIQILLWKEEAFPKNIIFEGLKIIQEPLFPAIKIYSTFLCFCVNNLYMFGSFYIHQNWRDLGFHLPMKPDHNKEQKASAEISLFLTQKNPR